MATLPQVRDALAALLKTQLGMNRGYGRMPSPLQPSTVFVVPQPGSDYLAYEEAGTFCRPVVALSAFAVVAATNITTAYENLDKVIDKALSAGEADPTLSGLISGLALQAVGEPGRLQDSQGGQLLGVELRFFPFYLS